MPLAQISAPKKSSLPFPQTAMTSRFGDFHFHV
jgi:hypothetical protein